MDATIPHQVGLKPESIHMALHIPTNSPLDEGVDNVTPWQGKGPD
jgi:hypothetical protein